MPQKAVLSRMPMMDAAMCALSRGMVRTDDKKLYDMYRILKDTENIPEAWESLFSLSCLLKDHPTEEPVAGWIHRMMKDTENGSFETDIDQQLSVARSALALYEYSTDQKILRRLARWCRWLETEWDHVKNRRWIRIQPADLMSFLVRYYRITGLKAVLRLCSRVRSSALDWTTILHGFHQRNPLALPEMEKDTKDLFSQNEFEEIDFFSMQYLYNHAEIMADGMRYTASAASYSGNGQEITAGKVGWETLKRYHGAACGGTTGNAFLGGRNTACGISAASTAAWTEAMIDQMQAFGEPWSISETVHLVYNALSECMNHPGKTEQYVNAVCPDPAHDTFNPERDPENMIRTVSRLARASAKAWQNAVTVSAEGICLNYLLPGRYMISGGGQAAVLMMDRNALHIRCKSPVELNLNIFYAAGETAQIELQTANGAEKTAAPDDVPAESGRMIRIRRTWGNLDTLTFHQGERIHIGETTHKGIYYTVRNRIMVLNVQDGEYRYAVKGDPFIRNGQVFACVTRIPRWPAKNGIPADIPVLPGGIGETISAPLTPYADTSCRISVFPREARYE